MSQLFASSGQSIGTSALASATVLPMNIQARFLLELTGLIDLRFKGISRLTFHLPVKCVVSRLLTW